MVLIYPKKYENDINPDTWDRAIVNFANVKQQGLNGFLLYRMAHYKDSKYNDTMLWYCIKEDFIRWIKEIWVPINKDIVWDFVTSFRSIEYLFLWIGELLETIFRSMLLTQKKSINRLHKKLSTNYAL